MAELGNVHIFNENSTFPLKIEKNLSALTTDTMSIASDNTYKDVLVKKSIEELKNRVIITDNDSKSLYKLRLSDFESIATYGLLTEVESIDTNKTNDLKKYIKNKLKELNNASEEISLTLLGDYRVAKGKIININISEYTLNGTYLITSAEHTISSNKEIVKISIEKRKK